MNTQPYPTAPMNAGGNRNAKNLPVGPEGREWSNGLCSCFDACGTCCLAWCCPCIAYGRLKRRYEHLNTKGYPDPEQGGCLNSDCVIHGLVAYCGFGFALQFCLRGEIRERYNIQGGPWGDCCTALCCTPCELTQETRELELEEASFVGNLKN